MPDYNITVSTTATGDGAKKTAEGLKAIANAAEIARAKLEQAAQVNRSLTAEQDRVAKSAKESAEVFKQAFAAQDSLRNAELQKAEQTAAAVKEALSKTAAATDNLTLHKGKLVTALRAVIGEVPLLSRVVGTLTNPLLAASAAVGAFVIAVQKYIDKQRAIEDAANTASRAIDSVKDALARQAGEWQKSADAAEDYWNQIKQINDEAAGIDALASRKEREAVRQKRVADSVDTARTRASEAEVEAKVAAGQMTPEQGAAAKAQLRTGLAQRGALRNENLLATQQRIAREAADQQQWAHDRAVELLPGAMKAAEEAERRAGIATTGRAGLKELNAAERQRIQAALTTEEQAAAGPGFWQSLFMVKDPLTTEERQDRIRQLRGQLGRLNESDASQEGAVQRSAANARAWRGYADNLKNFAAGSRRGAVQQLGRAEEFGAELGSVRTENAGVMTAMGRETRANAETAELQAAAELFKRQQEQMKALLKELFGSSAKTTGETIRDLQELKRRFDALHGR